MAKFRFALWAAVSTTEQAGEARHSLTEQEKRARSFGLAQGGTETAGPYILDGYSRTGYEGLSEAARDIPPLAHMLDDLDAGKFDVLICENYDRFGDIAQMLAVRFKKHKAQLVSVRQSGSITASELYDPYRDDATTINMAFQAVYQNYRINKLRGGWQDNVPKRIERGLHSLNVPYGYKIVTSDTPAEIVPEEVELLHAMKDKMLDGLPYTEIARYADTVLPPPRGKRWHSDVIPQMLTNPYYAGKVVYGKRMATGGKRVKQPRSMWTVQDGLQEPIWDDTTHRALVAERKRRHDRRQNWHPRYIFSGLTVCGTCGKKIKRARKLDRGKYEYIYMACGQSYHHFRMNFDDAETYLLHTVSKAIKTYVENPPDVDIPGIERELQELQAQRQRVQEGYEIRLYSDTEARAKMNEIEDDMQAAQNALERANEKLTRVWEIGQADDLHDFLRDQKPRISNQLLSSIIERIVIYDDLRVRVEFK